MMHDLGLAKPNWSPPDHVVFVSVSPSNDAPIAVDDSVTTNEDVPVSIDVLANDTDVENNDLTITSASANNGSVVINSDGTLDYTPATHFSGNDTITYAISDGQGNFIIDEIDVKLIDGTEQHRSCIYRSLNSQ